MLAAAFLKVPVVYLARPSIQSQVTQLLFLGEEA